jgi:hypothetical protein
MTEEAENNVEVPEDAEEAREVLDALRKLGPLFEHAARSLRPRNVIAEFQRSDRAAFFRNFKGQRMEKFNRKKVSEILHKEIFVRENVFAAHLMMVLWNEFNREVYAAMREQVETIQENVEDIERIEDDNATAFFEALLESGHSREDIYVCVCINDVRFSPEWIAANLAPATSAAA